MVCQTYLWPEVQCMRQSKYSPVAQFISRNVSVLFKTFHKGDVRSLKAKFKIAHVE